MPWLIESLSFNTLVNPHKIEVYFTKAVDRTFFYRPTSVLTHLRCWGNTRKLGKSRAGSEWFTNSNRVLPTSSMDNYADKPILSAVYCLLAILVRKCSVSFFCFVVDVKSNPWGSTWNSPGWVPQEYAVRLCLKIRGNCWVKAMEQPQDPLLALMMSFWFLVCLSIFGKVLFY